MFFSSPGSPNWHHATATSPSKTSAAWALPSRTSRSFNARLASYENSFSAWKVWNHVHQHPPHTPLCRSARSANASHVSGVRGRTVRVAADWSIIDRRLKETGPFQAHVEPRRVADPEPPLRSVEPSVARVVAFARGPLLRRVAAATAWEQWACFARSRESRLTAVQPSQPTVPHRLDDGSVVFQSCEHQVGRFSWRLPGCVEPPGDVPEFARHLRLQALVAVEIEPLLGCTGSIPRLADVDAGREDHQSHRTRGHQGNEEVEFSAVYENRVEEHREPEVDEVVRQRTHVSVAELVLPQRFVPWLAHEPHRPAPDHHAHGVAAHLSPARYQPRGQATDRRLPSSWHPCDDHAAGANRLQLRHLGWADLDVRARRTT